MFKVQVKVQVDQAFKDTQASSHWVNARTNEKWEKENNGFAVKGQVDWFSEEVELKVVSECGNNKSLESSANNHMQTSSNTPLNHSTDPLLNPTFNTPHALDTTLNTLLKTNNNNVIFVSMACVLVVAMLLMNYCRWRRKPAGYEMAPLEEEEE